MRELNLTLEPANDIGGGPRVAASPQERAASAKAKVMATYRNGVSPSFESFISKRPDGSTCACVIGTMALGAGSNILAEKEVHAAEARGDYTTRKALINQVCQATAEFTAPELLAMEEGFMGWDHGYFSREKNIPATKAFYEAGQEIAREVRPQV